MLLVVMSMVKNVVIIVALAHFISCVWWGIADTDDKSHTWIGVYGYDDKPFGYRYTSSLQWSLLLFAGGMEEMMPTNTLERSYAIVAFLLAYVIAAIFVSNLTSSMTQLHMLTSHRTQSLFILKRYLYQNGISKKLVLRVLRNAQQAFSERQRTMPEESVSLLNEVSEPLRIDIHFEMYARFFGVHPFFEHYMEQCPEVMRLVCHRAVSLLLVSHGDVIFNHGEIPTNPKMYFLCSGECVCVHCHWADAYLNEGTWISEGSLWTRWKHRGMLAAVADTRLCVLDAKTFQDIVAEFDHSDGNFDPKQHAHEFVERVNRDPDNLTDLPLKNIGNSEDDDSPWRSSLLMASKKCSVSSRHSGSRDSVGVPGSLATRPRVSLNIASMVMDAKRRISTASVRRVSLASRASRGSISQSPRRSCQVVPIDINQGCQDT